MPLTNKQLTDVVLLLGKQIVCLQQLFISAKAKQEMMGKVLAKGFPGLSDEDRQWLMDHHAKCETDMESYEAAVEDFRKDLENLSKAISEDES